MIYLTHLRKNPHFFQNTALVSENERYKNVTV